jgi:hypothetical protein
MSDIIEFYETYPEYLRDAVIFIVLFVLIGAVSKLYYSFKEEWEDKKLYKLYHQHLEDEKTEK